ncbi:alpha/beta hydrolase [Penicillium paradoxum]|uniref:alpha/beta hydrolase n=1 Tax=Penicillium paradoxum TaxID=176176 RepID=UPI0025496EB5|nr:alpha/beta hydrolase [Penicillium paradoxum]KAJ5793490.1 alpha/beta hydrolase [Penicillium paradoxum]
MPEEHTFTAAGVGSTEQEGEMFTKPVYPIDAFPGSRQFKTVYGMIHVFEWGPEDGEKVLLVHGLGTPCIALGGMAKELVRKGYRVMIYDLFGRGYSDAPNDLACDARLYTTQILLVLSSSPLSWTGDTAFHIIGFSLGGSIAVAFAAYHATMLRSVTLVCPGGLIRTSHMKPLDKALYSSARLIPEWLRLKLFRESLEPRNGAACADVPGEKEDEDDLAFDDVPIAEDRPQVTVGDVIRWQLGANAGFVPTYLSTLRSALVYRRHDRTWRILAQELAKRRVGDSLPGLTGGKICLIVATNDVIVVGDECASDAAEILGTEALETHVLSGGHEIPISRSRDVSSIAMAFWNRTR